MSPRPWQCGLSKFYCTGDGIRRTVPEGEMSAGGASDNTTRDAYTPCGGSEFFCVDGIQYYVGKGFYTEGVFSV